MDIHQRASGMHTQDDKKSGIPQGGSISLIFCNFFNNFQSFLARPVLSLIQKLIQKHLATDPVLPQYFYVPFGSVDEEREAPGSQHRVASNHGAVRELLHLWSQ